ncbi:hypothetical protein FNV43_RR02435 [Rhamnella rubrinervis]|uniref:Terpene synthase metal-binding domain-containing protein n=1 Tax=Rhamnella rubrinervis TaxID=2594499 RepID=A0A8K0MSZ4_9ROSA|nr:hypothetical protein FNV43_RR02435 [Rhamnella rubrinervis]
MRMGLPRIEARHYISIYQHPLLSDDQILLTFAKLISTFCKNAPKELSRYIKPQYALARRIVTKVMADMAIDDIYDVYATFDELSLHQQIERLMDDVVDHKEHNKGMGIML